ncbi:hypothetical protein LEMLEM_LOCUS22549 [Lemmus lemmus]
MGLNPRRCKGSIKAETSLLAKRHSFSGAMGLNPRRCKGSIKAETSLLAIPRAMGNSVPEGAKAE